MRKTWNYYDLTGLKFGKLTIIKRCGNTKSGNALYECVCDCGNTCFKTKSSLKNRKQMCRHCGNEGIVRNKSHGDSYTKLYRIWEGMKTRCFNKNFCKYDLYGGRGITICDEWLDYNNFKKWAFQNGFDPSLNKEQQSLDRIDCNGNYEPTNCRWADIKTQNKNRRINYAK